MRTTNPNFMKGLAVLLLSAALSLPATIHAQNKAAVGDEADASYKAYNSAFLVQTNDQTYYSNSLTDRKPAYMWGQASDIFVAEDYYARTHDPATAALISHLLDTFLANNSGSNWSWDSWNDDLEWGIIAFVRGYRITKNAAYLNAAETNWNEVYSRGWDDVDGGGIWENQDKHTKCALSNDPFVISGCVLYQITGDASYLTKSKASYAWVRTHLFNSTDSTNSLGPPGQVNEALTSTGALQFSDNVYNSGSFLEAADCLHQVTSDPQYVADALLDIHHIVGEGPVIHYAGEPGNPQYAYWFVKGLSDFCTDNHQWPAYYPWLVGNAESAWKNRDSLNLTEDNWITPDTKADPDALDASSAVTIWQVLDVPRQHKITDKKTRKGQSS